MSPTPVATLGHSQHFPLLDLPPESSKVDGRLPDFQYIKRVRSTWTNGHISLHDLCQEQDPPPEILVAFLPAEKYLIAAGAHEALSERFSIAPSFWKPLALEASGFFGSQERRDGYGMMIDYSSQFRFLAKQPDEKQPAFPNIGVPYCWHRLGFSVYGGSSHSVILCFDLPESLENSLMATLRASNGRFRLDDPFSLHCVLLGDIVAFFDDSLWSWRHRIRDIEKNRTSRDNPQPDYILMHEMARHAIHSSEMLAMAIETLASIIQEHEIFISDNPTKAIKCRQTGKDLRYFTSLFKCLHLRSKAMEERLRNEINLAFNIVAQHDSRIAMKIADATQIDSSSMKTIATLGFLFLPGTFICALFSTTFFSFSPGSDTQPQSWNVSEKFWIYWVVAIPVTVCTFLLWSMWQRWQASRSILKRPAL